jgi:hypothetical protein
MTIIDQAARATDRAAGVLQGAADTVQGAAHEARSGDRDHEPGDREAAAHARWQAGLPARNQFERDHFAKLEVEVTAGRMHLDRVAKQATAMEAAREAEAAAVEAGS